MVEKNDAMRQLFSTVTAKSATKKKSKVDPETTPKMSVAEQILQNAREKNKEDDAFVDKYAPIIKSLANIIATGPYDKEHDHKEENVFKVFQCVENARNVIGEKFDDYCVIIFPIQKRVSSLTPQTDCDEQQVEILREFRKHSNVPLDTLIMAAESSLQSMDTKNTPETPGTVNLSLWPDVLFACIQSVYKAKKEIGVAYDENVNWIREKTTIFFDEDLKGKKMDLVQTQITNRFSHLNSIFETYKTDSSNDKIIKQTIARTGLPFNFNELNYRAIKIMKLELASVLLKKCTEELSEKTNSAALDILKKLQTQTVEALKIVNSKCFIDSDPGVNHNTYDLILDCVSKLRILNDCVGKLEILNQNISPPEAHARNVATYDIAQPTVFQLSPLSHDKDQPRDFLC